MPATKKNKAGNTSQFASLVESGHPAVAFHSSLQPVTADVTALLTPEETKSQLSYHRSGARVIPFTSIPESIRCIIDSDMSSDAVPISSASFAAALTSLALPSLHAKAAEIRNQRAHLQYSNTQLQEFADTGDEDCQDALRENGIVLLRMQERLELLRKEVVENRGMAWVEEEQMMEIDKATVGGLVESGESSASEITPDTGVTQTRTNGHVEMRHSERARLDDEELARRLQERMDEEGDESNAGGVHL